MGGRWWGRGDVPLRVMDRGGEGCAGRVVVVCNTRTQHT